MKIRTFGEFYTFIKKTSLQSNVAVADFIACVSQYNYICGCKKNEKSVKHNICNEQYIKIVNSMTSDDVAIILQSTSDNVIEFCYNSNFLIRKISKDI